MKKVLTLMGALSVAGSAFAYDYDWALSNLGEELDWTKDVSKNGLTYKGTTNSQWDADNEGVVSDVKGSSQANCFTFKVQEGDNVIVHAINTGTSPKGFVYLEQTKVQEGQEETATVSNAEIDNSGTKQLEVTNMLGGTVYIYAEAGVVITKITVVSAKYREVVEEIKKASDAEEAARQEFIKLYLSDTNNTFNGFYDAIHKQLSNIAQKRLEIEATLKAEAAKNNVSVNLEEGSAYKTKGDQLKAALQALYVDVDEVNLGEIGKLKKDAADAMKAYKSVVTSNGSNAVAEAETALETAYNDPKKENNKTVYGESDYKHIYNPVLDSKDKITGNVERASGLKAYIDEHAKKYLADMKDAALADLSNFPSWKDENDADVTTYPTAKHNAAIKETVVRIHNSIYRKVYEQNHGSEYTDLQSELATIANDIKAAADYLTEPGRLATLTADVDKLVTDLNDADKHSMNAKAIEDNFITPLGKYMKEKNTIKANLLTEAMAKLKEKYDAVQTLLTDKSAQITELFNGQENTQAEYAVKFGKLQVRLNKVKEADTYADCVTGFNTLATEISSIQGEIDTMWQEALDKQSGEIVGQNNAAFKTLEDLINKVVDIFNEGVKKINGYKDIDGISTSTSAKATIDGELANMFKSREDIVKALNDATAAKNEANNAPVKSFDATEYTTKVNTAKSNIESSIYNARSAANTYAYKYLTHTSNSTIVGTLAYAKNQIISALEIIGMQNSSVEHQELRDYGTRLYRDQYDWHTTSKVREAATNAIDDLLKEYVTAQNNLIEGWNKTKEVPDHISDVDKALDPLGGKLTAILDQVVVYDEIDANITQKKVEWTVLKANVEPREDVDIDAMFSAINKDISDLEKALSEAGLDAKKENFQASLNKIAYDLNKVGDYDGYLAEVAALSTLNTRIAAVDNLVKNDAKKDLSETIVTEDILNDYVNKIEALQDNVANVQKTVDNYYKDFKLRKNVDAVEAMLKAIEDEVARLVADAKAADKAAQEVPGDVNDDKSVDAADYEAIEFFAVAGDDAELTDEEKALREKADLNGDGKVNLSDLSEFVKLYKGNEQE